MRVEIAHLHKQIGATMIYVTHDQVEAMTLADKIVVLRDGRIEQVGSPLELYENPDNRFVAGFIGSPSMNFVDAVVGGGLSMEGVGLSSIVPSIDLTGRDGETLTAGLRPQDLSLTPDGPLTVDIIENLGGVAYVYLDAPNGERLVVEAKGVDAPRPGTSAGVSIAPERVYLFDKETGQRIR